MGVSFGVANAPYPAEGGFNTEGGPHNNWAGWEQEGRVEPSGAGAGFYDGFQAHVDRAATLGLAAFHFGVSWARLQPAHQVGRGPEPEWDEAALDHYARIARSVLEAGMEPSVALHHFTHPAWLGPDIWLDPTSSLRFAQYAGRAVRELNRRVVSATGRPVRTWITLHAPNRLALTTYATGEMPGAVGRPVRRTQRALDHMLAAHVRAYDAIHDAHEESGWGTPRVAFTTFACSLYDLDRALFDLVRARVAAVERKRLRRHFARRRGAFHARFAELARRRWGRGHPQVLFHRLSRSATRRLFDPRRLLRTIDAVYESPRRRKLDVVGLDVHDPFVVGALHFRFPTPERIAAGEPVVHPPRWEWRHDPHELGEVLRAHAEDSGAIPLVVFHGGPAHRQRTGGRPEPRPDGLTRDLHLRRTFRELRRIRSEELPLSAFLYRTLVDDYDWGTHQVRTGLYAREPETGALLSTDGLGVDGGRTYAALVAAFPGRPAGRAEGDGPRSASPATSGSRPGS
ncbi:MAG: family 1 glycosylhydrolase [Myxococcota bacterium]